MSKLSENLRYYRKLNGYTQESISHKLDITTSAYGFYEQGRNTPPYSKLKQLSNIYNISMSELTGDPEKVESPLNYTTINVYGKVPAGIPIEAIEDILDTEDISFEKGYHPQKDYIGLVVDGDSMYPKYLKGDVVIIEVTPQCENGEDCVVYVNGYDATLKTVIKNDDGTITLKPINPEYPPKTYGPNDEPITILGVVKELRRTI